MTERSLWQRWKLFAVGTAVCLQFDSTVTDIVKDGERVYVVTERARWRLFYPRRWRFVAVKCWRYTIRIVRA